MCLDTGAKDMAWDREISSTNSVNQACPTHGPQGVFLQPSKYNSM